MTQEQLSEAVRLERLADETLQAAAHALEPEEAEALRCEAENLRAEATAILEGLLDSLTACDELWQLSAREERRLEPVFELEHRIQTLTEEIAWPRTTGG